MYLQYRSKIEAKPCQWFQKLLLVIINIKVLLDLLIVKRWISNPESSFDFKTRYLYFNPNVDMSRREKNFLQN